MAYFCNYSFWPPVSGQFDIRRDWFCETFQIVHAQLFALQRFEFIVQKYFSTRCETQSIQFNRSSAEVNFSSFLFQAPLNNENCSDHKFLRTQTRSRSLIEQYIFDHIDFLEKFFKVQKFIKLCKNVSGQFFGQKSDRL